MPGKSRRGRARHLHGGKKRKGRKGFSAPGAQPSAVTKTYEPPPQPDTLVPSAKMPTPRATVPAVEYPYMAAELRKIGIVAGIILVILVVLALVF